jgi:predicted TIM-barrel fold metal-dependent hydrolase
MRTIALEEHHASPEYLDQVEGERPQQDQPGFLSRLCDVGPGRIAAMDEAGIDVQVLALAVPGVEQLDPATAVTLARQENDKRGAVVAEHAGRFAGFATVPTPDPAAAADELERTVREYGFVGAMVNGHTQGRYLDHPDFRPLLARAEALRVPLYLHPAPPPQAVIDASYSGFSHDVTFRLANWGWGWHIDTGLHVLRLVVGGVFDRFPDLQVVVGHLGEGLPAMLDRIDMAFPPDVTGLARPAGEYFRSNVHYTTSGFNYDVVFLSLLLQVGADRIMFSTDYPYWPMAESRAFLDRLPVSPQDRAAIAHGNAERLLGLTG